MSLSVNKTNSKTVSLLYRGVGAIIFFICVSGAFVAAIEVKAEGKGWLLLLFGVVGSFAGYLIRQTGRQMAALSAATLLQADTRPPVVYLRSFMDDGSISETTDTFTTATSGGVLPLLLAMREAESEFAPSLQQIGPFVAIGRPGEKFPTLGAARMYVADNEWQGVVDELMRKARLILFRAGSTPGFWWEVSTATHQVQPEKIIFWLPFRQREGEKPYEAFRQHLSPLIPCELPSYVRKGKILYFDEDWTPHISGPKSFLGNISEARSLSESLDPVAHRVGVKLKRPSIVFGTLKFIFKLLLIVALMAAWYHILDL
jgi:hypothetical protein